MKNDGNDSERDLRARFEALRRYEAALSGDFEAAWSAARRRRESRSAAAPFRRRALLGAAGAAAVAAVALLIFTPGPQRPSIDEAIAQARELQTWSSYSDSLLPASDLSISQTAPGSAPGVTRPLTPATGPSSPESP